MRAHKREQVAQHQRAAGGNRKAGGLRYLTGPDNGNEWVAGTALEHSSAWLGCLGAVFSVKARCVFGRGFS